MLKRKNAVESFDQENICPRCGSFTYKRWDELTDEEKFLAERLPASAEYSKEQRKAHHFCTRCWFEEPKHVKTTT